MTVEKNLSFGLRVAGLKKEDIDQRVKRASEILQIQPLLQRKPANLSGGQRQRVAIARALVNRPSILLADEPTGNLDSKTSEEIMRVFEELSKSGQTVVMVTHEPDIAAHARRVVVLRDGMVASDERREQFVSRIGVTGDGH
jgi:putative ABC transport system ATP-binding protein